MNIFEKIKEKLAKNADTIYKDKTRGIKILFLNEAIEAVNEVAEEYTVPCITCNKVNGWIPCSERLPEDGQDVLVWFEYFRYGSYNRLYQTMGISFTLDGKWSGFVNGSSGWSQLKVIAWQPLPEPYKTPETTVKDMK